MTGEQAARLQSRLVRWIAIAALALVPSGATHAKSAKRPTVLQQAIVAQAKGSGLDGTILVARGDTLLFRHSFGLADRAFQVTARPGDRYRIASITKLFTATLILQLVDGKRLALDDKVASILGAGSITGAEKITVRQLLNHSSGIRQFDQIASLDQALKEGVPQYQRPRDSAGLLASCCLAPLDSEPGKMFAYNNADYLVLEKIVEKLTGQSFAEALAARITRPLGLRSTGMAEQSIILPRLNPTYYFIADKGRWMNDLPVYFENWGAAGGMVSTVDDLHRFAAALYGGRLVSRAGLDALLAPGLDDYGLGLWSYSFKHAGRTWRVAKRPGSIMGANAQLYRLLDANLSVIILANTNRADLDTLVQRIAESWIDSR